MGDKRLPLATSPIMGFLHHGYPLSIVLTHEKALPWLYSNYIQLIVQHSVPFYEVSFDFYYYNYSNTNMYSYNDYICPFLQSYRMDKHLLLKHAKLTAFLKDSIDQGFYIFLYANEKFVPHRTSFLTKKDQLHGQLVFGYESDGQIFELLGFDEFGTFRSIKITAEELAEACDFPGGFEQKSIDHICLLRKEADMEYPFQLNSLIELLKDFVEGRDSNARCGIRITPHELSYGINVYSLLEDYLTAVKNGDMPADFRQFHLLWEHKQLMLDRIAFLTKEGYVPADASLYSDYVEVEQAAHRMRGYMFKVVLAEEKEYIDSCLWEFKNMVKLEIPLLYRLIEYLEASRDAASHGEANSVWDESVQFEF